MKFLITRTFPEGPGELDVIAIYEIEGGMLIRLTPKATES
jgi:hypothetical protein